MKTKAIQAARGPARLCAGLLLAALLGSGLAHAATSANYELTPVVLDSAGQYIDSADYTLDNSTGQAGGAAYATSANYETRYGFIPMAFAGPAALVVTAPNGGEEWACGITQTITWDCNDIVSVGAEVRIGLHKGAAFIDWIVRRTDNDGTFNWIVWTDLEPDDDYTVRVQSYTNSAINDYSDAPFTVTALGVKTPNGGETWTMGSVYAIQWAGNPAAVGAEVRVGLHYGVDFLDWINRRTDNDGAYSWMIPADLAEGPGYRVRVQSYTDSAIRDLSDTPFTLELPPLLWISPAYQDELISGQAYQVTWGCNDMPAVGPDVRIGLHKGGAFIDWMIRKTENDGTWNWSVPAGLTPAPSYRLRLQSYTDKWLRSMSPAFTVSSPK